MKKYNYLSQSQKLLLAAMTIPLAVTALPTTDIVHASEVPTLNLYELNGSPKLEWATEILQENILSKTGFENGEIKPVLHWGASGPINNYYDRHYISQNEGYLNSTGYVLNDNSNGKGNFYEFPNTSSNSHVFDLGRFNFENGTNLSISLKTKLEDNNFAKITPIGAGGYVDKLDILTNKLAKSVSYGENKVYVDSLEDIYIGKVITFDENVYNVEQLFVITDINHEEKSLTLHQGILKNVSSGTNLKNRDWYNPFQFYDRTINNSSDWQTLNFNVKVGDNIYYDSMTKGISLLFETSTNGKLKIDDITFGYATEVEVYRDGQSVYKGFLADFHDTSVKDNVKPNKVSTINSSITNNFDVDFNIEKPMDNGTKVNYQIQSIAKNGNRSALSTPQEIEVKTDVVKYKYSISKELNDTPIKEIDTLNNISIPLKLINLETDYLHIQAIDTNGNVSDISSFKLNELIDMKDLYDKFKELEDSNDYNDFIDFIDEIENLYGDNLPQDLKEMIDRLGQHHGVNTSFLLLEEGDFRLATSDINSFGKVKLTAKKQTITTTFKGDFSIIDARGTQEGWHVTVSATPFTVETFDGFVGTPHQLPLGSLALNNVNHVEQIGTVHNSQLPSVITGGLSVIDGENHSINLLQADKQKGMGEFKFSFTPNAIALTVDAVTAKIDTVNYPDKNTPYVSTVTWDLVSGPQI